MENLIEKLENRGFINNITDKISLLDKIKEPITCYAGFDPTAKSLHVGSLVPIIGLMLFQKAGHRPIVIIGGATGQIGDPSGKDVERELLSKDQINENKEHINRQLSGFLDFENGSALMLDNADWADNYKYIDFLRDIGKHITINRMISHESIKRRMEDREHGISYTEFSYLLLQASDFLYLFDNYDCILQIGGSDQWGNIVEGIDLIRRMRREEAYGITFPLLTTSAGQKFGKTESGTVWLDPELTSPYKFYQYWINTDDRDVIKFLHLFTFLEEAQINELKESIKNAPEKRQSQKTLAFETTRLVHGEKNASDSKRTSEILFAGSSDIRDLSENMINDIFADVPSFETNVIDKNILDVALLAKAGNSKSEIRRKIREGGLYINNIRIKEERNITRADLIHNKYLILRKGKKNYILIKNR